MKSEIEINRLVISVKNNIKEEASNKHYFDVYMKSVILKTLEWVLNNEN